jgi:predicted glycoside hydrolase/deacetylase ChbG (UPF0249 family)
VPAAKSLFRFAGAVNYAGGGGISNVQKLIVNADDFGLTSGINQAIVECFQAGALSSTTLMVASPAAEEAAGLAAANPGLGVGIHLNLTNGRPAMPPERVPSLVGRDGRFPGMTGALLRLTSFRARTSDLAAEIGAQIEMARALGIEPTHIDSHHHLHAHPRLRLVMQRVCRKHGIAKARGYRMIWRSPKAAVIALAAGLPLPGPTLITPGRFGGIEAMGGKDMAAALAHELAIPGEALEFMCHPGHADEELRQTTSYNDERGLELEGLLSPRFTAAIRDAGARLISFREL